MVESLKRKPYYSIFMDLVNHPYLAKNQELAQFLADFIYQKGYRKQIKARNMHPELDPVPRFDDVYFEGANRMEEYDNN